ncbi:hypothetical protein BT69DRAFT_1354325 [Atractiella rhizophila]|nr:hypothetical protein BT69DRAFT_1354325 [Atractiella rhizophila]
MSHPFSHIPGISYDTETEEPFLKLPPPLDNYRLTPWRSDEADIHSNMEILNDKRVYMNLLGPPFPYTIENARFWCSLRTDGTRKLVTYLRETKDWRDIQKISGCPFEVIRYSDRPDSAGGKFLGSIDARPLDGEPFEDACFPDIDFASKQSWMFGDLLSPEHHGKGVMSACLSVLLAQFFDPIMRVKHWKVTPFVGNWASRRVFEKNGFSLTGETKAQGTLAHKGGPEEMQEWVLERRT